MKWLTGIVIAILIIGIGWYVLSSPNTATGPTASATQDALVPGTPDATYKDSKLSFSMNYPASAKVTSDFSTGYLPRTDTPLISFQLPQSMFTGTNLGEAGVYIGATTSPAVMKACTDASKPEGALSSSTVTIGGQQFVEVDTSDAAAGNLYQEKTFRAFQNGACLEIVELLHSGNIGNYTPGTVQEFDETKFSGILDAIVKTYTPIPTGE